MNTKWVLIVLNLLGKLNLARRVIENTKAKISRKAMRRSRSPLDYSVDIVISNLRLESKRVEVKQITIKIRVKFF